MEEVRPTVGMLSKVGTGHGEKYPGFSFPPALQSYTSSSQWLNLEAEGQGSLGKAANVVMGGMRQGKERLKVLLQVID